MKRNRKGFTLIELLAVIIILGVLLVIAVPSVTRYIENSRKSSYLQVAEGYVDGVKAMITSRKLSVRRKDTTYYIPIEFIETEKGGDSPYGNWVEAYVVVVYANSEYDYYWTSVDDTGHKIELKNIEELTVDDIINDSSRSLNNSLGIGDRDKIFVLEADGNFSEKEPIGNI